MVALSVVSPTQAVLSPRDSSAQLATSCSAQRTWIGCPELTVAQQSRVQANEDVLSGAEPGQPSLLAAAVTLKHCLLSPDGTICVLTFDLYFFQWL